MNLQLVYLCMFSLSKNENMSYEKKQKQKQKDQKKRKKFLLARVGPKTSNVYSQRVICCATGAKV